jgi:hypothetical protein
VTAVQYLLAAFGAVTTGVLLWKAFGPEPGTVPRQPGRAPDDDPDFLRELDRRRRPDPEDEA